MEMRQGGVGRGPCQGSDPSELAPAEWCWSTLYFAWREHLSAAASRPRERSAGGGRVAAPLRVHGWLHLAHRGTGLGWQERHGGDPLASDRLALTAAVAVPGRAGRAGTRLRDC